VRIKLRIQFWRLRRRKCLETAGDWDPGARPEPRNGCKGPAQVGATPVADLPFQTLESKQNVSMSRVAEKIDAAN
jgi:hypothetical protein